VQTNIANFQPNYFVLAKFIKQLISAHGTLMTMSTFSQNVYKWFYSWQTP